MVATNSNDFEMRDYQTPAIAAATTGLVPVER